MVERGTAERVYDSIYGHIGFRLVQPQPKTDNALPTIETATVITEDESLTNAGAHFRHGRSRTKGMREDLRLSRVHSRSGKMLPAEDFVERATEKIRLWPVIGDTKATRVSPRG